MNTLENKSSKKEVVKEIDNNSKENAVSFTYITAQELYDEFEKKYLNSYQKDKKEMFKLNMISIKKSSYFKLFIIFIIVFIILILFKNFIKVDRTFLTIFLTFCFILLIAFYEDYRLDFNKLEIRNANKILKEILDEREILINKDNLEILIYNSKDVGNKDFRLFSKLKNEPIVKLLGVLGSAVISIYLAIFVIAIEEDGFELLSQNMDAVNTFIITMFLIFSSIFYFSKHVILNDLSKQKIRDLYILTLKEKKFNLELKYKNEKQL